MTETANTVSFFVWLCFWPVWLAWECVLLWWRGQRISVSTLSQVARDRSWQVNSAVYLWNGLGTHFWWPGWWAPVATSIIFWVLGLFTVIGDVVTFCMQPNRELWPLWVKRVRTPLIWMVLGLLGGVLLFPQHDTFFQSVWSF